MFKSPKEFACTMLRLAGVLIAAAFILSLLPLKGAGAQETQKVVYNKAFPKPIGILQKKDFVWGIAATYQGTYKVDKCEFVEGDRGRITILRTVTFANGEGGWIGTDVWSDEDAASACMVPIDFTKFKRHLSHF